MRSGGGGVSSTFMFDRAHTMSVMAAIRNINLFNRDATLVARLSFTYSVSASHLIFVIYGAFTIY